MDASRRRHVRAAAEIDEARLLVGRDFVLGKPPDHLALVILTTLFEELDSVLPAHLRAPERAIGADDLLNPRFALLQIFRGKRPLVGKIVIETLFNRRTDGQLRRRKKILDGLRHNMCAAVAIDLFALRHIEGYGRDGP